MTDIAIRSSQLTKLGNISHGFFTRQGGVSSGIYTSLNGGQGSNDATEHVIENRRLMAEYLSVEPHNLVSSYQVHSSDVATVIKPWSIENRPKVDAMVTNVSGVALGISTADCGPVLFADSQAGVIGAAHAGWKGAVGGVMEATVRAMEKLGARRKYMVACLGMTISAANYEVGAEFVDKFMDENEANSRFFVPSKQENHSMFDLPAYIMARLKQTGIEQLEDLALCTYADEERFFSYRRVTHRKEPDYGRHISAIALI